MSVERLFSMTPLPCPTSLRRHQHEPAIESRPAVDPPQSHHPCVHPSTLCTLSQPPHMRVVENEHLKRDWIMT